MTRFGVRGPTVSMRSVRLPHCRANETHPARFGRDALAARTPANAAMCAATVDALAAVIDLSPGWESLANFRTTARGSKKDFVDAATSGRSRTSRSIRSCQS